MTSLNVILEETERKPSVPLPRQKYYKAPTSESLHNHIASNREPKHQQGDRFPSGTLQDLKSQFGEPTYTTMDAVVWNHDTLRRRGFDYIKRLMVRSEGVESTVPERHMDHVYMTVTAQIPSEQLWNTLQISDALTYDRGAQTLTVRCAGWRTCGALMLLALRAARGELNYREAKERDIVAKVLRKAAREKGEKYFRQLQSELNLHK